MITHVLSLQPNPSAREVAPRALASLGHNSMETCLCSSGNSLKPPAALSVTEIDS